MVLLDLLFPRVCPVCGRLLLRRERYLCLSCLADLPLSFYWSWPNNPAEICFWGRLNIVRASSLLIYREGSPYKKIIHSFKYNGNRGLCVFMGEMLARRLAESKLYEDIDAIVPVPLHPLKKWKRGYNQSSVLAKSIGKYLKKPVVEGVLVRNKFTPTQTKKDALHRWENVMNAFSLKNSSLIEGKHILLVDDVLTTGATLEACGQHIMKCTNCRLSIVTLAYVE
ncbi:MAG: ComF family protein [Bacteroidales bacterium]